MKNETGVIPKLFLIWTGVLDQCFYFTFTDAYWPWLVCELFAKMLYSEGEDEDEVQLAFAQVSS